MDRSGSSIRPLRQRAQRWRIMRVICACRRSRSAKVHQADIAAGQRAIKQQQQQRASLLAQLKAQEEAIAAAARKLRETGIA